MVGREITSVREKLTAFRRKYYLNLSIKGVLLTLSLILFYFLVASLIEYNLWLGTWARFTIFFLFFGLVAYCIFRFLKKPIAWWLYQKGLDQNDSARLIGSYFPSVGDRLLNLLQLSSDQSGSALVEAGVNQKSKLFDKISFDQAIDFKENGQYLKYLLIPTSIIVVILFINTRILTQSSQRIVNFTQEFSPDAPFKFQIQNKNLNAFFNEDFTLELKLKGEAIAEAAYIISGNQRLKMESIGPGEFIYLFEKIQSEIGFQIEASGFFSDAYTIVLANRPEITELKVSLEYPRYLGRRSEELKNAGNLEVPEGTKITWNIGTANATKASMHFSSQEVANNMQLIDDQLFSFGKNFNNQDQYSIELENDQSKNKDKIAYSIAVVKDAFPEITVDYLKDSVLFRRIILGGAIFDDYGVTQLDLMYQVVGKNLEAERKVISIPINKNQLQQSFFYNWQLDSLILSPGDRLDYFLQVWDNDGVNGRKATKSASYVFSLPSEEELKTEIVKAESATEGKFDQSLKKAKDLKEVIEDAKEKLKGKQDLDWQDKKMLEQLIEQKQNLDEMISELQKQNELLEEKKNSFSEQSEKIKEKSEQIKKLMEELLDPETKKLFEELQKLLKENSDMQQVQKLMDKMDRKEINLEKELERTLELFKQLKYDYKLEQAIGEIKEQAEKQQALLEKTEGLTGEKNNNQKSEQQKGDKPDTNNPADNNKDDQDGMPENEKLANEQENVKNDIEKFEKSLEDLKKMGEELNEKTDTPSEEELNELKETQEDSKESLKQNKPKKASESQKKALKQMKQMQEQMENMQSSMEMDEQNLEAMRQIIHGLIKLSFDEESLMKEFAQVQQTDPKYISLSQTQLKLKDDAKVLEDSLLALAKKDPFLGSVVTKEVGELNDHMDKTVEHTKERRKGNASSEMQLSMTSMNNLALMLNDHFDAMMDMMKNAKPKSGKGKKKSKEQSLGEMQQKLNKKIEDLKNGGKTGRQLSEEVAEMAAEQERIRRALQEMQEKLKKEGGKIPGNDLPGKMEQTEMDLVNKQITEQTIRRQKDILTRLLETEKSMREQNQDQERKGETAKDYNKEIPKAFEEYLRLKEKEVELLKTMPPKLYPYYKKEVNEYFKRVGTQD
jgi:hypothetical protein